MPSDAGALLTLNDLNAYYGDFQALFAIDLTLGERETVAIIGANGAGKSTLMRCIMGLMENRPDMIRLQGEPIGAIPAYDIAAKGVALVPEGRRLFSSLSVEENLIIGGRLARPGVWTLETVYDLFPILRERRHAPSDALSGGQRQMVAIGRALMANPDILMIDEASLGLAPVIIRDIYAALPSIKEKGSSIIIVEQDINQALAVADRFYCMQEGRISLEGRPEAVERTAITQAYFGM